jgi:polyferredoxin
MYTAADPLLRIEKDTEEYRDHINTIRPDGKRAWIFAKKPRGRFYRWRTLVSYVLLALMFFGPYVRIHGQPLLLINVLERKFILFGFVFWPQDFYLVVLGLLTLILTIVLFTSVFGRIWCGWTCPQTVFMEMVFRKIEYLIEGDFQQQKQLAASAWNANKILRKGTKFLIFYIISFAIANTFLAYIIGSEELWKIITEPVSQHIVGFIAINLFTIVFFLVFARFREQVCHFACPYGRFQSVLVDNDTISVTYDFKRGEKRATLGVRKKAAANHATSDRALVVGTEGVLPAANHAASDRALVVGKEGIVPAANQATSYGFGDCIDCGSCVVVCPSGIDIRNGIQLECVQCTACIDACDKMMDAVGKPRGLIRYTSYNKVKDGRNSLFKLRTAGYLAVWLLVLSIFTGLLLTREKIETVLLRQPGMLAQRLPDGYVGNLYSWKVFNKTFDSQRTDIRLAPEFADKGEIRFIDTITETAAQNFTQVRFLVALKPEAIGRVNIPIEFDILLNGQLLRKKQTVFIAPGK